MERNFTFKSNGKFIVTIKEGYLTIRRKGMQNFLVQGSKGEKTIPIKSITAIQLKEPRLTTGYLQFAYSGSNESKGGFLVLSKTKTLLRLIKRN